MMLLSRPMVGEAAEYKSACVNTSRRSFDGYKLPGYQRNLVAVSVNKREIEMKKLLIVGVLALTGCVTNEYAAEKSVCENKPSWVEYAQCSNRIGAKYYGGDPLENEMIAYRNLLIEKVQNKQMAPAEAEYLRQQKWNQAKQQYNTPNYYSGSGNLNAVIQQNNDRMMETIKNNQQNTTTPAPLPTQTKTECRPNLLGGGFDCTTY